MLKFMVVNIKKFFKIKETSIQRILTKFVMFFGIDISE